jgi:hypothetical protein
MARAMPMNHSLAVVMRAPRSMSLAVRDIESRELTVGCGPGLGGQSGFGQDGDTMEGQGMVEI